MLFFKDTPRALSGLEAIWAGLCCASISLIPHAIAKVGFYPPLVIGAFSLLFGISNIVQAYTTPPFFPYQLTTSSSRSARAFLIVLVSVIVSAVLIGFVPANSTTGFSSIHLILLLLFIFTRMFRSLTALGYFASPSQ